MCALNVRKLNKGDYDNILVEWWKDWNWESPKKDFLPDNGEGGIIVFDDDVPICAGFIYVTNSSVCWVDWIISNRNYTFRKERRQAIRLLINTLTNICKDSGSKYIYALIKNQSLIKVYEEEGYNRGDSYTNEMIKTL